MDASATLTEKNNLALGTRHWLWQVIPPSLMLCVFFVTMNGTSLVFLTGIFTLPVLVSIISIIAKLIFFKKRKYYLVRPLLTIAIFILIIVIANWSYEVALDQAVDEARKIHRQCNENLICPENPAAWRVDGPVIRKNDLGLWLKYSALYYYHRENFYIRVYQGPDMGDSITGGVNLPFKVDPYVEN